ncbi:MAG: hypothetical protein KF773_10335 [Deltaproteobacteria bacterium]|nr:hypothetical protein [Deltaproteobacteria bacterium]MCW5804684.1 hypothetical protein [Deltaproteobacteria bacterium]
MRLAAAVLVVLTACGAGSRTPSWPRSTPHDPDGGESLEPRMATSILAVERTPEPAEKAAAAVRAEKAAERSSVFDSVTNAAGSGGASSSTDVDVLNTDDIVIEINDD